MAVLAYFQKIVEDDQHVRYRFGPDPDDLSRSLTIDKEQGRVSADSGEETYLFRGAARSILRRFHATGEWPERGMHAS